MSGGRYVRGHAFLKGTLFRLENESDIGQLFKVSPMSDLFSEILLLFLEGLCYIKKQVSISFID